MRLAGTRRARVIAFLLSVLAVVAVLRLTRVYVQTVLKNLGPTLVQQAQKSLKREIRVDRFQVDRPGLIIAEGLRVARGETFKSGTLLTARKIEVTYDPALLEPSAVLSRWIGKNTRARIRIEGIRFWQPDPLPDREFGSVEAVWTDVDLRPVLNRSGDPLPTIRRVDVLRPRVLLARGRDRRWNFEDLLKKREPEKPTTFRGEVVVTDGVVEVEDHISGDLPRPARNRVLLNARASLAAFPLVRFTTAGEIPGQGASRFAATGHAQTETKLWFVSLDAGVSSLPYWYRYLGRPAKGLDVLGGSASVRGVLWSTDPRPEVLPQYKLTVDLLDGAIRHTELPEPVRDFTGRLTLGPSLVQVNGSAALGELPVSVQGEITPEEPLRARLRVQSDRITLAAVRRLAPKLEIPRELSIPRPVSVVAYVDGRKGAWNVRATADLPEAAFKEARLSAARATFQGVATEGGRVSGSGTLDVSTARYETTEARDLRAAYQVRDRVIHVRADLKALGGALSANGWIDAAQEPLRFYAAGKATGIDASRIPLKESDYQVAGTVDADFVASGTPEGPVASAFVRGTRVAVKGKDLDETVRQVTARVYYSDGAVDVPYATVEDPRLSATLSGNLSREGALDFRAHAAGIDLAAVLAGRTDEPVQGTAYLSARVTGTLKEPRAEGQVQVYRPGARDFAADYLEGRFAYDATEQQETVTLTGVRAIRAPACVTAEEVVLTRPRAEKAEWSVRTEATATGLSLVPILRLAGVSMERLQKTPVSGQLGPVRITVTGTAAQPSVTFEASVERLAAQGFDLGRVALSGSAQPLQGRVTLSSLTTTSEFIQTSASGTVLFDPKAKPDDFAKSTTLDLKLKAGGVHLLPLIRKFAPEVEQYVDLSGTLESVEATVTGKGSAPQGTATVRLADMLVNERAVPVDPFTIQWSPTLLVVRGFRAQLGSGQVELPQLIALLGQPQKERDLLRMLSGYLNVREVQVGVIRQLVQDSPWYRRQATTELKQAIAQWQAAVGGDVTATVSIISGGAGPNAPRPLPGMPTRGQSPLLVGEIRIPNLASPPGPNQPVTKLATNFTYNGERFDLSNFRLDHASGGSVTVAGFYLEKPKPGSMQFDLSADNFKISTLTALPVAGLAERVHPLEPLEGEVDFKARITGSSEQPNAAFSLVVDRPVLAGVPLDRISLEGGEYSAANETLRVTSGQIVKKHPDATDDSGVRFTGFLPLTWPKLTIPGDRQRNLTINLPEQSLTIFNAIANDADKLARESGDAAAQRVLPITSALREVAATKGVVEGRIVLGGTADKPQNDGFLAMNDAGFKKQGAQTELKNLNFRLELAGDQVRVVRLYGESSEGGYVEGRGEITLGRDPRGAPAAKMDLSVAVNEFKFVEKKVASLVGESFKGSQVRGTLQTVNPQSPGTPEPISIAGTWPSPTVKGAVKLDDANLSINFEPLPAKESGPLPGRIPLDGYFILGNNVWFRNAVMALKLDGSLHATNTVQAPVVRDEIQVSRGTINLPMMRIRRVEGTLRVAYDGRTRRLGVESPSPVYVDLTGYTTLRLATSAGGETEFYDATIEVKGTPGQGEGEAAIQSANVAGGLSIGSARGLTITMRTDPPLPGSQIEALIRQQVGAEGFGGGGTNVVQALGSQIEQAFAVGLTSAITGRIEDLLQTKLGLDIVAIDVGLAQPLRVRLGKRLFRRFYGTVTHELDPNYGNRTQYELYYRITPALRVGLRRQALPFPDNIIIFSGSKSFR